MRDITYKPEILAPAGSFESLRAAVNAGADAVYLGGEHFSARAFASNFSEKELLEAIDFCHIFDIKVYLAINTLLKQNEAEKLAAFIEPFYRQGVDAVLVQDMGAAKIIRETYPELPVHASTQMSISSSYGAKLLKDFGFSRIVPARELSLKELISIKEKVDIEIETFVHGALCFAYSGRCLFSSYQGGRSGNRGRCAQPCRMSYKSIEKFAGNAKQEEGCHIMSLKDMSTLQVLPELIDAKIDSFKIEGRMKNPVYVAATVDAYKRAVDDYIQIRNMSTVDLERAMYEYRQERLRDEKRLKDIYNRGGFCKGYYFEHDSKDMFAFDRPNHNGIMVGNVCDVKGANIHIKLCEDINPGDVLEVRTKDADIELTSNVSAISGEEISLKGRSIKDIKTGQKIFRTKNKKLSDEIKSGLADMERKNHVKAMIYAKKGEPLKISLSDISSDPVSICVEGTILEKAQNSPTDETKLKEKLSKTNGSNISIETEFEMDPDVFIPMGDFNNLRREAMDSYKLKKASAYHRDN